MRLLLPDIDYEGSFDGEVIQHIVNYPPKTDQIDRFEEVKPHLLELIDKNASKSSILAILAFLYVFGRLSKEECGIVIEFKTELPVSAGLGSSAAYCVCLAAGLLHHFKWLNLKVDESDQGKKINEWAFIGEKIIHGSPSGIDNTIATFGKIFFSGIQSLEDPKEIE